MLLLLVVGAFVAGCGGSATVDTTVEGSSTGSAGSAGTVRSEPVGTDGPSAGPAAPFGTVTLVDGTSLDGAEYAGDDLALWFWAPW